ncbi:MAG TPA: hypothetical protein VGZ52_01500, partial [Acidimicrobiales bacterium]|nr:hypothetical protein [Acidimicrobiales bacterium]
GIGCWWYAARSLAAELTDARTRAAAIVNVYGIGLTINIASWDLTILSDSLAVSLTVLLMALWWRELHHPGRWTAVALVVASILWVFTRHSNVLVNHLIVIAAAASIVSARPRWRRAAVVAALVATSCWGQYALTRNHYDSRVNINALIIERIEPTPSYLRWWIDHGLPRVPQRYAEVEPTSRLYEPGYVAWLDRHGESTYALSLITHPAYTLASPWTDLLPFSSGQLEQPSTTPTMLGLAEHYGKARDASRR